MSRCWPAVRVILLALFVVAAAPSAAPAAEGGGGAASELFAPRLDLMIWTIVVFGLLLFVLKKFAWGPMLQGLQGREERIRGALEEAQTARDEAQKLRNDLQAEMNKVYDKIREMMDEARREGQAAKDNMVAEGKTEIQAERDRSLREIERDFEAKKQELWNQTAQLATLISAKALGRSVNEADHRHLVDEALAEMRNTSAG
jgi:F-type H+-transporting ATPase subunit b